MQDANTHNEHSMCLQVVLISVDQQTHLCCVSCVTHFMWILTGHVDTNTSYSNRAKLDFACETCQHTCTSQELQPLLFGLAQRFGNKTGKHVPTC